MKRITATLVTAFLMLACGACADNSPSSGTCTGKIEAANSAGTWEMDPAASDFRNFQSILHHTELSLSYGAGALVLHAVTRSQANSSGKEGDHTLGGAQTDAFFESWNTTVSPGPALEAKAGTFHLTQAASDRLVGTLDLTFADESSVTCSFNLRRAYEKEN